jgi:hypothetical protein
MRSDVKFDSAGLKLAGHLYTPDDGGVGPRPAIVVSHPASGVKEQAVGLYVSATAADHSITVVATVSGVDVARQFRYGADGTQPPTVFQSMLDAAAAARTAEARGEDMGTFPLFPGNEEQARAGGRHVFEGWEYYCTDRAQHARSAKTFTWSSVDRLALAFRHPLPACQRDRTNHRAYQQDRPIVQTDLPVMDTRRVCMVRSSSASNYRRVLNAGVLLPSAIQHAKEGDSLEWIAVNGRSL